MGHLTYMRREAGHLVPHRARNVHVRHPCNEELATVDHDITEPTLKALGKRSTIFHFPHDSSRLTSVRPLEPMSTIAHPAPDWHFRSA